MEANSILEVVRYSSKDKFCIALSVNYGLDYSDARLAFLTAQNPVASGLLLTWMTVSMPAKCTK
jgi:hypothetical protein